MTTEAEGYPFEDLVPTNDGAAPLPDVKTKIDKRTGAEYVPKSWKPSDRPVAYGSAIAAVLSAAVGLLAVFGVDLDLSADQTAAVVGAVSAVIVLVQAVFVQRRVAPWKDEGDHSPEGTAEAVARYEAEGL